ncbi:MAG: rod shape-determining protein MreC [Elusimicrobia bacterium]|nr:rod shape-determining protein MreC [Elusimicrobiota bacterium]
MQRETRIAHYVAVCLAALSLVLLSLPLSSPVRAFKACAAYVFDPLPYEGEQGYQRIALAPERVRALLTADVQNRRLQDALRGDAWLKATAQSLAAENDRLRADLGLKTPSALHPLWAHVMERDPLRWYSSFSVDAGADLGVTLNDAVLGRSSDTVVAVGRVVDVRPREATVLLLTDERSAVAAYLSSGTLEGLVQGQSQNQGLLLMSYINSEARIVPGDTVYTSPTSVTFPPDVLIGRVAAVNPRDPFLASQSVEISPASNAAALQEVLILRARAPIGRKFAPAEPVAISSAPATSEAER